MKATVYYRLIGGRFAGMIGRLHRAEGDKIILIMKDGTGEKTVWSNVQYVRG